MDLKIVILNIVLISVILVSYMAALFVPMLLATTGLAFMWTKYFMNKRGNNGK